MIRAELARGFEGILVFYQERRTLRAMILFQGFNVDCIVPTNNFTFYNIVENIRLMKSV
jgi:hypothetical protein